MPEEELWETFFQPESILEKLGLKPVTRLVVDFGCGYGTFSLPAAKRIEGRVVGLDSFSVPGAIIDLPPWHYGLIGHSI